MPVQLVVEIRPGGSPGIMSLDQPAQQLAEARTGVLAGSYPALYLSSLRPLVVLRRNGGLPGHAEMEG